MEDGKGDRNYRKGAGEQPLYLCSCVRLFSPHNSITFCIHFACGFSDYKSAKMEFTDLIKHVAVVEIVLKLWQVKFKLVLFSFTELLLFSVSKTNIWKKLELTPSKKNPNKNNSKKACFPKHSVNNSVVRNIPQCIHSGLTNKWKLYMLERDMFIVFIMNEQRTQMP